MLDLNIDDKAQCFLRHRESGEVLLEGGKRIEQSAKSWRVLAQITDLREWVMVEVAGGE